DDHHLAVLRKMGKTSHRTFREFSDAWWEADKQVKADCLDWLVAVGEHPDRLFRNGLLVAVSERRDWLTERERKLLDVWRRDHRERPPIVAWVRGMAIRRAYPNKPPKQDIPWPVRVTQDEHGLWRPAKSSKPPKKWSPRRWFGPGQSAPPLR